MKLLIRSQPSLSVASRHAAGRSPPGRGTGCRKFRPFGIAVPHGPSDDRRHQAALVQFGGLPIFQRSDGLKAGRWLGS